MRRIFPSVYKLYTYKQHSTTNKYHRMLEGIEYHHFISLY